MASDVIDELAQGLPASWAEARRSHLMRLLSADGATRPRASHRPRVARLQFVVVAGLILVAVVCAAAAAIGFGAVNLFDNPHAPKRIGGRFLITSGSSWSVYAWRSARGLCDGEIINGDERGTSCGINVIGAPGSAVYPDSAHMAVTATADNGDSYVYAIGVTAADVSRATVTFGNGTVVAAQLLDAPDDLNTHVRFFVIRVPDAGLNPLHPVASFTAYEGSGATIQTTTIPNLSQP